MNDVQKAIDLLEFAMECDSTNPAPYLSLAVIYQDQDEMDLAERHYKIAVDVAPTQAHVQQNIGMFYHTIGKVH